LALSHWDPYAVRRGSCLELYHGIMLDHVNIMSDMLYLTWWSGSGGIQA